MPPSVESVPLRDAVESEVSALERLCADIERAMMERDWSAFATAMAESRRVTHAMQNCMEAAAAARDADFDEVIFKRLRYVYAVRENQLARLSSYHDAVGERLTQIGTFKRFAKSVGSKRSESRLGSLDRLR